MITHLAQNELVEKGLENRSLGELRLHWQDTDETWLWAVCLNHKTCQKNNISNLINIKFLDNIFQINIRALVNVCFSI